MQFEHPPFELGETLDGTDSNGNLINQSMLGRIYEFPAQRLGQSIVGGKKGRLTGRSIKAIALRNVSGQTLYGKRLALLVKASEDSYGITEMSLTHEVDGYAAQSTADKNVVIIDEFIENNGVADDDIFWGILKGPVTVKSQAKEDPANTLAYGECVAAGTANATSGQTTAGGVVGHTCPQAGQLVGKACTTYNDTANTFVDVQIIACIDFI